LTVDPQQGGDRPPRVPVGASWGSGRGTVKRSGWIPEILTLLVLLGAASSSWAQQPEPSASETVAATAVPETPDGSSEIEPPLEEGHVHDGFLFRAMLGGGYYYRYSEHRDYFEGVWTESVHSGGGGAVFAIGGSAVESFHLYGEVSGGWPHPFSIGVGLGGYLPGNWMLDASFGWSFFATVYGAVSFGREWWISPEKGTGILLRTVVSGDSAYLSPGGVMTSVFLYWTITYN
jgi:hypothetical protein